MLCRATQHVLTNLHMAPQRSTLLKGGGRWSVRVHHRRRVPGRRRIDKFHIYLAWDTGSRSSGCRERQSKMLPAIQNSWSSEIQAAMSDLIQGVTGEFEEASIKLSDYSIIAISA